jgi:WW domain-containing oxidoreductase
MKGIFNRIAVGCLVGYVGLYSLTNYILPFLRRNPKTGFSSTTTADEVAKNVEGKGRVAIVTGSTGGLGKVTARVLASRGYHVVLTGTDPVTLKQTQEEFKAMNKDWKVTAIPLDLGDKNSVENFVHAFESLRLPLHILILNAGVMNPKRVLTKDGFESHIGVNHLGGHRLTMKLLPIMRDSSGDDKRIVVLTSALHRQTPKGDVLFDDFQMEKDYGGMQPRYCHSKLCNIMFANELNRKLRASKIDIYVNSVHPGIILTELHRNDSFIQKFTNRFLLAPIWALVRKNVDQGSSTSVYAAIHPEMAFVGGQYLENNSIGHPLNVVKDEEKCRKLWNLTEELTEEKYPFN